MPRPHRFRWVRQVQWRQPRSRPDRARAHALQDRFAAGQQVRGHGLGVVPPQFVRHATAEGERFDQAVQDRLGALSREGEGERAVGAGPGDEQDGDEGAARREIDEEVAEAGFEALAGVVVQGDEGFGGLRPLAADVKADPLRTAGITVFVAEAAEDLGGSVALLAGGIRVGAEDVVDDRLERVEDRRRGRTVGVGLGLGLVEDLADLAAGVREAACQFADAEFFNRVRPADACVLVHLDHPSPPDS